MSSQFGQMEIEGVIGFSGKSRASNFLSVARSLLCAWLILRR
jgi:hypothetical protein